MKYRVSLVGVAEETFKATVDVVANSKEEAEAIAVANERNLEWDFDNGRLVADIDIQWVKVEELETKEPAS